MTDILQDLSTPALIRAIEANFFALWVDRSRLPQVEVHDEPARMWFVSGLPFLAGNGVLWAQFAPDEVDARIEETLDLFRSRGVPLAWWIGPSTRPVDLGVDLEAHGLIHTVDESGMAADLLALREDLLLPALTIKRVANVEELRQWVRIFAVGFGVPPVESESILAIEAGLGLGPELPRQLYLGLLGTKPVATSLLFMGAGVAGLYGVTTIPEARRQGIGTAMTLAALQHARSMGYRVGVLSASAKGLSLYRRLGFWECCKLRYYVWEL